MKERLASTEADESFMKILTPIFEELVEKGSARFPKTIVYLPLKWCGRAHHAAQLFINEHGDGSLSGEDMVIAQYHSPQAPEVGKLQ